MTDTTTETHVNGTAPPAAAPEGEAPCADCASGGEKALAVFAAVFGLFLLVIAVDMFTGGRVTGMVRERAGE
jgi:hypothetical protein